MKLTSPEFRNSAAIPLRFTGEGRGISPPLNWSGVPEETREFVLICEDPDAPIRPGADHPFVHWVIYNLSPTVTQLPEGLATSERLEAPVWAHQGRNSFRKIGYGGPLPPQGHGPHHYVFKLYALDTELAVPPGASRDAVLAAMQGHILDETELVGTFERHEMRRAS